MNIYANTIFLKSLKNPDITILIYNLIFELHWSRILFFKKNIKKSQFSVAITVSDYFPLIFLIWNIIPAKQLSYTNMKWEIYARWNDLLKNGKTTLLDFRLLYKIRRQVWNVLLGHFLKHKLIIFEVLCSTYHNQRLLSFLRRLSIIH